ncbi:MAG: leucine-rich repeat protein [Eubacterium sp.]|nr:leucine-rich repeat protein [Eubacterium sp.]
MAKKNKKTTPETMPDFLEEEAKEAAEQAAEYTIDIPEDEIWTYQVEGLQQPRVGVKPPNVKRKKIIVIIVLLVAISASIFLSVRALYVKEFNFKQHENGDYYLYSFSNPGEVKEVTVDYYTDNDGNKDETKPIVELADFAFNCDDQVTKITVGKDVKKLSGKSFYSCWSLQYVDIDDANPNYCDVDGVVYTKDMKEIVYYPIDHDRYLRLQNGYAEIGKDKDTGETRQISKLVDDDGREMEELWGTTEKYDEEYFAEYNNKVRTYVIPSSVEKIGDLCFTYVNINYVYIPEGVKELGSMAFFDSGNIWEFNSYTYDKPVTDTSYKAIKTFKTQYKSLPEGLEVIGSDCFTKDKGINYMYVPSSVKEIGHHAFWETCFKEEDENGDKVLKGVTKICVGADEQTFNKNVKTGDQWLPKYEKVLVNVNVDVEYGAERETE